VSTPRYETASSDNVGAEAMRVSFPLLLWVQDPPQGRPLCTCLEQGAFWYKIEPADRAGPARSRDPGQYETRAVWVAPAFDEGANLRVTTDMS